MSIERTNRATAAALGFLTVAGIFAVLAVAVKLTLNAPAIDADRAAQRSQALAEIHAAEETTLTTTAVIDSKHGVVRLPIDTALALAAHKWQNPSAARADLNARAEKSVTPVKTETFE